MLGEPVLRERVGEGGAVFEAQRGEVGEADGEGAGFLADGGVGGARGLAELREGLGREALEVEPEVKGRLADLVFGLARERRRIALQQPDEVGAARRGRRRNLGGAALGRRQRHERPPPERAQQAHGGRIVGVALAHKPGDGHDGARGIGAGLDLARTGGRRGAQRGPRLRRGDRSGGRRVGSSRRSCFGRGFGSRRRVGLWFGKAAERLAQMAPEQAERGRLVAHLLGDHLLQLRQFLRCPLHEVALLGLRAGGLGPVGEAVGEKLERVLARAHPALGRKQVVPELRRHETDAREALGQPGVAFGADEAEREVAGGVEVFRERRQHLLAERDDALEVHVARFAEDVDLGFEFLEGVVVRRVGAGRGGGGDGRGDGREAGRERRSFHAESRGEEARNRGDDGGGEKRRFRGAVRYADSWTLGLLPSSSLFKGCL